MTYNFSFYKNFIKNNIHIIYVLLVTGCVIFKNLIFSIHYDSVAIKLPYIFAVDNTKLSRYRYFSWSQKFERWRLKHRLVALVCNVFFIRGITVQTLAYSEIKPTSESRTPMQRMFVKTTLSPWQRPSCRYNIWRHERRRR